MQLVFATNNAHKVAEVRAILASTGFEILSLSDAGLDVDPEETEDTFEGNARLKADAVGALVDCWVMADDSGLEVDALNGLPGVHSKRYSEEGTHAANNTKLLAALAGVQDRSARFRCVLAVRDPQGNLTFLDGRCEGRIATALSGSKGFGYDPLFVPDAYPDRTMAELSMEQKNSISHRGAAFGQLTGVLP